MKSFPKLKLSYFDLAGRAEATRLAFFIGGIPFEDDRFDRSGMAQRKHEFPYEVAPVLQVDGEVLAESSAIARYAGRLAGLYPTNNPLAATMVDEIMHAIDEFGESFRPWFMASDVAVKANEEKKLIDETIPRYLAQIDARLAEMKTHPTFQDDARLFLHELWVYQYLKTMLLADWLAFVPRDVHKPFQHWVEAETKVASHPRVREWNALQPTRPKKLTLTYFDLGGRAEPIRLALHLSGLDFEDKRVSNSEAFAKLKPTLPYGALPVLHVDDTVSIAQTYAILRYVGGLAGLYPTAGDELLALRIDEVLSVLDQLQNWWAPAFASTDEETKRVFVDGLVKETIPKFLGGLDKRVASWAMPCATGEKLTIADLAIYGMVDFLTSSDSFVPTSIVDAYPALLKIHALVKADTKVVTYYAGRGAKQGQLP